MPTDDFTGLVLGTNLTGTDNLDGTITIDASGGGGVDSLAKDGDTQLTGDVTLSEGSNITLTQVGQDIEIASAGGGGGAAPGYGTSLPGSPADGDEYILVNSTAAPDYFWRFRYSTAIGDAYKWVFIGGSPWRNYIATQQSTTSTANTDLTTPGPQLVAPRAGLYWCETAAFAYNATAGGGAKVELFVNAGSSGGGAWGGATFYNSIYQNLPLLLAASDVVKMRYRAVVSGTAQFGERQLLLTPIRVS